MEDFTTPRVQKVVREARDHAGITNATIAEAINREDPGAAYDNDRVRQELCRPRLGAERMDRLILGTYDAVMLEDTPRRREAARWLLAEAERLGRVKGPFGPTERLADLVVEAAMSHIRANDVNAAKEAVVRIFQEQDLNDLH